jgi:hypothetical protein
MEISDVLGDGTATVLWRDRFPVRLRALDGEMERKAQKVLKAQWRGHQRIEDKVDPLALRDFYCDEIVLSVEGLTKDGQPYGQTAEHKRELWDKTPDFRVFVLNSASEAATFMQEKKA